MLSPGNIPPRRSENTSNDRISGSSVKTKIIQDENADHFEQELSNFILNVLNAGHNLRYFDYSTSVLGERKLIHSACIVYNEVF